MVFVNTTVLINVLLKMASAIVSVLRWCPFCLLPHQEFLQDQQVGLSQSSFKLLPLFWDLEHL